MSDLGLSGNCRQRQAGDACLPKKKKKWQIFSNVQSLFILLQGWIISRRKNVSSSNCYQYYFNTNILKVVFGLKVFLEVVDEADEEITCSTVKCRVQRVKLNIQVAQVGTTFQCLSPNKFKLLVSWGTFNNWITQNPVSGKKELQMVKGSLLTVTLGRSMKYCD